MAGRRRGRYPPEYKERIVELVRAGRSPGSLARDASHRVPEDPGRPVRYGPGPADPKEHRTRVREVRGTGKHPQALLWFRQEGVELPSVEYGSFGRGVVWKLPVYSCLHHIVTNPVYAGAYAYGRTRTETAIVDGQPRRRSGIPVPQHEWAVLIPGASRGLHRLGAVSGEPEADRRERAY